MNVNALRNMYKIPELLMPFIQRFGELGEQWGFETKNAKGTNEQSYMIQGMRKVVRLEMEHISPWGWGIDAFSGTKNFFYVTEQPNEFKKLIDLEDSSDIIIPRTYIISTLLPDEKNWEEHLSLDVDAALGVFEKSIRNAIDNGWAAKYRSIDEDL